MRRRGLTAQQRYIRESRYASILGTDRKSKATTVAVYGPKSETAYDVEQRQSARGC